MITEEQLLKLQAYWDNHPNARKPWELKPVGKKKVMTWMTADDTVVPMEALLVHAMCVLTGMITIYEPPQEE